MSILILLLIPFIGAFISLYLGTVKEWLRDVFNMILTLFMLVWIGALYPDVIKGPVEYYLPNVMGTGLYLKVEMLQFYLIALTAVIWSVVMLYSTFYLTKHRNRNRYYFCYLLTCSFTFGIFMSENLVNLFTFFEAMTFSSYILIIHDEDDFSHQAGLSYLAMAITGGLVMLMGILIAFDYTNTLLISELAVKIKTLDIGIQRLIGGLIVFGFGVKSSMFPLHTWLSKAYVAAPTPATAVISGVLLKTGLYGMFVASTVLIADPMISYAVIVLGSINMLLGGFLAMNQRNVKRIIAYSSMSQAGFMIVGIGLIGLLKDQSGIAFIATVLFMINHAVAKVLLFLVIGVIVYWIKELSLTHIWGFGRNQMLLKILFLIGVLGTIGFPGFNGFTSKTLLHEAIIEAREGLNSNFFMALEGCYYLASTMTVAYMLKIYIALFVSKNKVYELRPKKELSFKGTLPVVLLSMAVVAIGLFPEKLITPLLLYAKSNGHVLHEMPHFYTMETIGSSMAILFAGMVLYIVYIRTLLVREEDGERVYLNHTLNWFSIEDDLYKPVLSFSFKWFTKIFDFVDSWMLKATITVKYFYVYIINIDSQLLKKLEWDRRIIDQSTNLEDYEIHDDLTLQKKTHNLKESFVKFYFNVSSINYTVLFVASVLVLLMIILFLVR